MDKVEFATTSGGSGMNATCVIIVMVMMYHVYEFFDRISLEDVKTKMMNLMEGLVNLSIFSYKPHLDDEVLSVLMQLNETTFTII